MKLLLTAQVNFHFFTVNKIIQYLNCLHTVMLVFVCVVFMKLLFNVYNAEKYCKINIISSVSTVMCILLRKGNEVLYNRAYSAKAFSLLAQTKTI